MKIKDVKLFKETLKHILSHSISQDYVNDVFDAIYSDVKEDVECCADEDYSCGDIQLAIGRVLVEKLGKLPF